MFRGMSNINMDAKGRFAFPARHRDRLAELCGGQLVATIDIQSKCLLIYPLPEWEQIEAKLQALPAFDTGTRRIQRLLLGHASELELDGNGRVLLPPPLRDYAQLDKKLCLLGMGKKFELWSEALWAPTCDSYLDAEPGEAAIPEEMMSLSL